jgi:hypothetical protein
MYDQTASIADMEAEVESIMAKDQSQMDMSIED